MRNAVKGERYWFRAIEEAKRNGYTEFCITWNPYPGATEMTKKYVIYAKNLGFDTNITTVLENFKEFDLELLQVTDIVTWSIDDLHGFDNMREIVDIFVERTQFLIWATDLQSVALREAWSTKNIVNNINLLWTPKVFEWLFEDDLPFRQLFELVDYPNSIQHLIYKPLTLYPSMEWFLENYSRVVNDYPWVDISGNGQKFIGDIAFNNRLGLNNCPGEDYQMVDIDPMGYVRRCPENPTKYDGRTIIDLKSYLSNGTPCKSRKCNCI